MIFESGEVNGVVNESALRFFSYSQPNFRLQHEWNQSNHRETIFIQEIKRIENKFKKRRPAIFVINNLHEVIYWNKACESLTGIDAAAILGTDDHQVAFTPEKQPQVVDIIVANDLQSMHQYYPAVKTSSIFPSGFRVRKYFSDISGKASYVNIHGTSILDEEGKCLGAIEIIFNKPHSLPGVEGAPCEQSEGDALKSPLDIPIQTFYPNGRIKSWNQASEKFFQTPHQNFLNKSFQDFLSTRRDRSLFNKALKGISTKPYLPISLELQIKTPGGRQKSVYSVLCPLCVNGRLHEINCTCFDYTDHKHIENALNESYLKYHELFENTTDLLAIIDLKGNIRSINQSFASFVGLSVSQLEQMNIQDLISKQDFKILKQRAKAYLNDANKGAIEFLWNRPDNTQAFLDINFRFLRNNKQNPSILVIAHDHTARRNLEHDLQESYRQVITSLVNFIDTKDAYTGKHSQRLVKDCLYLANQLGLSPKQKKDLEVAAILHDVGKIKIPKSILEKFGNLTEQEKKILHTHAEIGANAVERIPRFYQISKTIKYHHERYDGTGYPEGLTGKDIPVEARILAVVDAFDAMMNNRPYRKSLGLGKALKELKAGRGTQFDPVIVNNYLDYLKRKYHVDDNGQPDYLPKS